MIGALQRAAAPLAAWQRRILAEPDADPSAGRTASLPRDYARATHLAILAISGPADSIDSPPELRLYVRQLLGAGYTVVLATAEHARLTPLRELIAAHPTLCPIIAPAAEPFGLWRAALERATTQPGHPQADRAAMVLASTLARGPFAPLRETLRRFDHAAADLWGITESWTGQYHLPGCFLGVGPAVLRHPAWAAFWAAPPPLSAHPAATQQREIALTQTMLAAGLRVAALHPYRTLLDRAGAAFFIARAAQQNQEAAGLLTLASRARLEHLRRVRGLQAGRTPMDPLSFLWEELLDCGAPFVARSLLARNPHGIVTASLCADRVRAMSHLL